MKKIIVLLVCLLSFYSMAFASSYTNKHPKALPEGENMVLGIKTPVTVSAMIKSLGTPTSVYTGDKIGITGELVNAKHPRIDKTIYFYNGIGFVAARLYDDINRKYSDDLYVLAVDINDRSAVTKSGLAVGDPESKITALYGNPIDLETKSGTAYSGDFKYRFNKTYKYLVSTGTGLMGAVDLHVYVNKGIVTGISVSL